MAKIAALSLLIGLITFGVYITSSAPSPSVRRSALLKDLRAISEAFDNFIEEGSRTSLGVGRAIRDRDKPALKAIRAELQAVLIQRADALKASIQAFVDKVQWEEWKEIESAGVHPNEEPLHSVINVAVMMSGGYRKFGTEIGMEYVHEAHLDDTEPIPGPSGEVLEKFEHGQRRADVLVVPKEKHFSLIVEVKCTISNPSESVNHAYRQAKKYRELITLFHEDVNTVAYLGVNLRAGGEGENAAVVEVRTGFTAPVVPINKRAPSHVETRVSKKRRLDETSGEVEQSTQQSGGDGEQSTRKGRRGGTISGEAGQSTEHSGGGGAQSTRKGRKRQN